MANEADLRIPLVYGKEQKIYFSLWIGGNLALCLGSDTGDILISKDGGAFVSAVNNFVDVGGKGIYELTLGSGECECKNLVIYLEDVAGGPNWDPKVIICTTSDTEANLWNTNLVKVVKVGNSYQLRLYDDDGIVVLRQRTLKTFDNSDIGNLVGSPHPSQIYGSFDGELD